MSDISLSEAHGRLIATAMKSAQDSIENKLFPLWNELYGTDGKIIHERCETVKDAIGQLVEEMIHEEQENKAEYTIKYEGLLQEANTLESELSIVVSRTNATGAESLCVKIRNLEQDLEQHRRVKQERLSQLKTLQDEENELCSKLEQVTQYSGISTVPSESTLEEITSHVQSLSKELVVRRKKYETLRTEVMQLWTSLQVKPDGEFEMKVHGNELANKLGTDNLDRLAGLKISLERTRDQMSTELDTLRNHLSTLWNRLDTKSSEREKFVMKHNKLNTSTIEHYKKEIQVCQALKLKHIEKIVGAIRSELEDWWDKAHIGRDEREKFVEFYLKDNITEEVLEAHEREVERMRQYYEDNRDTLDLLGKRFELWHEMIHLEEKANDKERLFKNRGGQLLLEEKKRKFIQKELPKLEKALDKLFDRYEKAHEGAAFLYDGQEARAFLASQWEERNSAKENSKKARKNVVGGSQPAASKLLGPPQNVTARHTPGRNATLKRKATDGTPSMEQPRRGRVLESATRQNALWTPASTAKKPLVGGSSPASSVLSYSLFQRNVTMRRVKRSSSLPKLVPNEDGLHISSSGSIPSVLRSSISHEALSIENQIPDSPAGSVEKVNGLAAILFESPRPAIATPSAASTATSIPAVPPEAINFHPAFPEPRSIDASPLLTRL